MDWWEQIFDVFKKADVRQVAYVPDAGHTSLINACISDNDIRAISLTTEEEGMSLLAGAWLGGQRGAMLMQSSGVGNCINMLALNKTCQFPLLILATMRGQYEEFNPWQEPMGSAAASVMEAMGVHVHSVNAPDRVGGVVETAARAAFGGQTVEAVLLHQKLMSVKTFGK